jgi:hypothetical protein
VTGVWFMRFPFRSAPTTTADVFDPNSCKPLAFASPNRGRGG